MKKLRKIRCFTLVAAMLLFPVVLYYLSPVLIINAAFSHTVNGSFIVFCLMTLLSIPFGRVFCAYLCPAGGIQECLFRVQDKPAGSRKLGRLKYVIWAVWLTAVICCYAVNGITAVDPAYMTFHGISVTDIQSYIIYYGIVTLIVIPSLIGGRRAFCRYICWMAPFMVLGTRLRRALHLPGLTIKAKPEGCLSCGKCTRACPMSIDVANEMLRGSITGNECIQCGECIHSCPAKLLEYAMIRERKDTDERKEA